MNWLPRLIRALRGRGARPWILLGVAALVASVFWFDLATGPGREPGTLYDLPIIVAAVTMSLAGAVGTAVLSTAAYLITLIYHRVPLNIADLSQAILFILMGAAVAKLVTEYLRAHAMQTQLRDWNQELERRIQEALAAERAAQKRIKDRERLSLMGEAAAKIVHEIRNPLVSIGGFARRAEREVPEAHPARADLGIVIEEVARLEAFLRDLLEFGRPVRVQHSPIDLGRIITEVAALARVSANAHGVLVSTEGCESAPMTFGDADQIKRALLNVALNGIQAMSPGGVLAVGIETEPRGGTPAVKITFQDGGCGIPGELLPRVFEPFFTTRRDGTGLGLPLVKHAIEAHGGAIEIESCEGRGTLVTLWLPIASEGSAPVVNIQDAASSTNPS